mgnify:CR=1 FL=1
MKSFLVALMPALIPIVLSLVFILVLRAVCIRVQRPGNKEVIHTHHYHQHCNG